MGQGAREERHLGSFSKAESLFDKKKGNLLKYSCCRSHYPFANLGVRLPGAWWGEKEYRSPTLTWNKPRMACRARAEQCSCPTLSSIVRKCCPVVLPALLVVHSEPHLVLGGMAGSMDFLFHTECPYIAVKKQIRRKT